VKTRAEWVILKAVKVSKPSDSLKNKSLSAVPAMDVKQRRAIDQGSYVPALDWLPKGSPMARQWLACLPHRWSLC